MYLGSSGRDRRGPVAVVHEDLSNEELTQLEQEQTAGLEVGGEAPPSLYQLTTGELSTAFSHVEAGLQVLTSNSSNDK